MVGERVGPGLVVREGKGVAVGDGRAIERFGRIAAADGQREGRGSRFVIGVYDRAGELQAVREADDMGRGGFAEGIGIARVIRGAVGVRDHEIGSSRRAGRGTGAGRGSRFVVGEVIAIRIVKIADVRHGLGRSIRTDLRGSGRSRILQGAGVGFGFGAGEADARRDDSAVAGVALRFVKGIVQSALVRLAVASTAAGGGTRDRVVSEPESVNAHERNEEPAAELLEYSIARINSCVLQA